MAVVPAACRGWPPRQQKVPHGRQVPGRSCAAMFEQKMGWEKCGIASKERQKDDWRGSGLCSPVGGAAGSPPGWREVQPSQAWRAQLEPPRQSKCHFDVQQDLHKNLCSQNSNGGGARGGLAAWCGFLHAAHAGKCAWHRGCGLIILMLHKTALIQIELSGDASGHPSRFLFWSVPEPTWLVLPGLPAKRQLCFWKMPFWTVVQNGSSRESSK